jgi:transcriptional regulator of arginine metabolism
MSEPRRRRPDRRREAVARILRAHPVSSQEELLERLEAAGFRATQATLSRDLARLGAHRVASPTGGSVYELSEEERRDGLEPLRGLVRTVSCNGALVVVRTHPGSAPAIARAIDLARIPELLGTIAGDDTIFVAPAHRGRAHALAGQVRQLLGAGAPS